MKGFGDFVQIASKGHFGQANVDAARSSAADTIAERLNVNKNDVSVIILNIFKFDKE